MSLRLTLLAAAALTGFASGAHAATFNLAGSAGASTTFSVTSGGQTATFTSPGTNTFTVGPNSGLFSFPLGLGDVFSSVGDPLTISFSTPVTQAISFAFGVEDLFGTTDTLSLAASNGQTASYLATSSGVFGSNPEGTVSFVPTSAVSAITLTSAKPYAIGSITTGASTNVPEPMSLTLLGTGLVGLAATRRRV